MCEAGVAAMGSPVASPQGGCGQQAGACMDSPTSTTTVCQRLEADSRYSAPIHLTREESGPNTPEKARPEGRMGGSGQAWGLLPRLAPRVAHDLMH